MQFLYISRFKLMPLLAMSPYPEIIEEINLNEIYLRKISKKDGPFFYKSLRDKNVITFLSLGPLLSKRHSKELVSEYLKSWEKNLQYNYIIELRDNLINKIGSASLWNVIWHHKRAEIGIWLIPEYWNQGYGKKALNLIKLIGFNHLNLNRLEAHVATENLYSLSLFKSSGFQEEGRLKQFLNLRGKFHDVFILAALNETSR